MLPPPEFRSCFPATLLGRPALYQPGPDRD